MESNNDRVKLSVWTASNGAWRFLTSRADARQAIDDWKNVANSFLEVKGRVNDADQNAIDVIFATQIITAIDIVEINREF